MEELLQIGLGLFGGLALFLYGMNLMSNNLQEAAGERMRAILAAVTKNPFFGVLAGALATAVPQSRRTLGLMMGVHRQKRPKSADKKKGSAKGSRAAPKS